MNNIQLGSFVRLRVPPFGKILGAKIVQLWTQKAQVSFRYEGVSYLWVVPLKDLKPTTPSYYFQLLSAETAARRSLASYLLDPYLTPGSIFQVKWSFRVDSFVVFTGHVHAGLSFQEIDPTWNPILRQPRLLPESRIVKYIGDISDNLTTACLLALNYRKVVQHKVDILESQ